MFEIKDKNNKNKLVSKEKNQEDLNLDSSELLFNELSEDLAEVINGGVCPMQVQLL